MYYRLLPGVGSHTENGTLYRAGDVVRSRHDLAAMFPQKFEQVVQQDSKADLAASLAAADAKADDATPQTPATDPDAADDAQDSQTGNQDAAERAAENAGVLAKFAEGGVKEVTEAFDGAGDAGLRVFQLAANKYLTTPADNLSVRLSEATKAKTIQFIADYA